MKLVSWNVNGVRSVMKKGFGDFVLAESPDVLCLQETKTHEKQNDDCLKDYKHHFWHPAERKGYAGTAVFSKSAPKSIVLGSELLNEKEGRVMVLEYDKFFLVNVYTPNSQRGLTRLAYRMEWDKKFLELITDLGKKKKVIVCGDLNVAHKEIDLKNPKQNERNAGFTKEEREGFDNFLKAGFVDTFRHFNSEGGNYTWWSYMFNAREKNIGWRIDYFLAQKELMKNVLSSKIMPEIKGSDHCPVVLELKF